MLDNLKMGKKVDTALYFMLKLHSMKVIGKMMMLKDLEL